MLAGGSNKNIQVTCKERQLVAGAEGWTAGSVVELGAM